MKVSEGTRYGLYSLVSVAHLPRLKKFNNAIEKIKSMIKLSK